MNLPYSARLTPLAHVPQFIRSLGLINLTLSVPSIIPESIFHVTFFGRRYLTWWRLAAAATILIGSYYLWTHGIKIEIKAWRYWLITPRPATIWGVGFISIWIGFALFHRIITSYRRWTGTTKHAYHRGTSIFKLLLDLPDYIILAWIEPLMVLSVAVWIPDGIVQVWLAVTGVALWWRVHIDVFFTQWSRDDRISSRTELDEGNKKEAVANITTVVTMQASSRRIHFQ